VAATPALIDHLLQVQARPATPDEVARVHSPAHIESVRAAAEAAKASGAPVRLDVDTLAGDASWDAALAAAGCALDAARLVATVRAATGFALCRPPGHHATPDRPMGFCLFNNIAVAARALQAEHGVGRILIVDWDVHHGNGTQDAFHQDPTVYYLSQHQHPWYPGTGLAGDRGEGAGEGTTRNVPVPAGLPAAAYLEQFRTALDETLAEFAPEFVLVSAGFDALRGDPLGGQLLEPADLHAMMRHLMGATESTAGGRVVAVLEGGYEPRRTGQGVVEVLRALAGLPARAEPERAARP
jgi:acetoin utilization deacetylase AcuC-like enzyme